MAKHFKLLTGDVSGIPATYFRHSEEPGVYDVYEVNEWADLDSSAVEQYGKYNIQSGRVDLLRDEDRDSALRSCGFYITEDGKEIVADNGDTVAGRSDRRQWDAVLVQCMWGYGAKLDVEDFNGNNLAKLVKQARGAF